MDKLFNCSQKFVLIKDMSKELDFTKIENRFSSLTFKNNINNKISNEMNFFDAKELKQSKKKILETCHQYLNTAFNLEQFYEQLKLTYSWGNITEPMHMHHEHVHPFSIVSGVIFLDNNPTNLNLYVEAYTPDIPYFITKNKSYVSIGHLLEDSNINSADVKNLQHYMVLFLSNTSHFVQQVNNAVPRRSLSFNTMWQGHTGVKQESLGSLVF